MQSNPIVITDFKDLVDWVTSVLTGFETRIDELERRADVQEAQLQEKIDELTAGKFHGA